MSESESAPSGFQFELIPIRPSRLLGERLKFERSTALGFSPDTLLRALTGRGFQQLLEESSYKHARAQVALAKAETTGSRLRAATLTDAQELVSPLKQAGRSLTLDEVRALPESLQGPSRLLRRAWGPTFTPTGKRLLTRLAYYDRVARQITLTTDAERNVAFRKRIFGPTLHFWHGTGLGMRYEPTVAVDAALRHLVWLDLEIGADCPLWEVGTLLRLSEPSTRPMRHWFDMLLLHARCNDLGALENLLAKRGAVRLGRSITHDRLRKWASTQALMPLAAVEVLLETCVPNPRRSPEALALWGAKLLTFLVEVVRCFTPQEVEPLVAQAHVHDRLKSLHSEYLAARGTRCPDLFLV